MTTMTPEISNSDDIIDSRDVIERIAELQLISDDGGLAIGESAELAVLVELARQGKLAGDWIYGATLIRDSYFVEYAKELANDLGAVPRDAEWPARHIDWEAAADELQTDYTSVEFDGVTYWVR